MPYDYYPLLKKINENENYKETTDIVRENLWEDTQDFKLMQEWMTTEDKIKYSLYLFLRYI